MLYPEVILAEAWGEWRHGEQLQRVAVHKARNPGASSRWVSNTDVVSCSHSWKKAEKASTLVSDSWAESSIPYFLAISRELLTHNAPECCLQILLLSLDKFSKRRIDERLVVSAARFVDLFTKPRE